MQRQKSLICDLPKKLAYHGGTTNLREHLISRHNSEYKPDPKQKSILNYSTSKSCSVARKNRIMELIVDFIALDMCPLRTVEGKGFLRLLSYLEPGYIVPNASHISTLVNCKHKLGKQKLMDILEKDALSLSLTTDKWTSIANEAYLTVSAHYISSELKFQSYVLATSAFPECHTAAKIAHKLVDITDDYKITS